VVSRRGFRHDQHLRRETIPIPNSSSEAVEPETRNPRRGLQTSRPRSGLVLAPSHRPVARRSHVLFVPRMSWRPRGTGPA
jgi:hypothetical protein